MTAVPAVFPFANPEFSAKTASRFAASLDQDGVHNAIRGVRSHASVGMGRSQYLMNLSPETPHMLHFSGTLFSMFPHTGHR